MDKKEKGAKTIRGYSMQTVRYVKPNMTYLKGKKGRAILAEIRSMKVTPMHDVQKDADECMKRILARRKNAK